MAHSIDRVITELYGQLTMRTRTLSIEQLRVTFPLQPPDPAVVAERKRTLKSVGDRVTIRATGQTGRVYSRDPFHSPKTIDILGVPHAMWSYKIRLADGTVTDYIEESEVD